MVTQAIVVDTSALLAFFDTSEPDHQAVTDILVSFDGHLVVSPYVIAELDYLVLTRRGVAPEVAALRELAGGAWELADLSVDDLQAAADVVARYADQKIGVADASIVVLAARYGTTTIATLDHRHFSILRGLKGEAFTLVP